MLNILKLLGILVLVVFLLNRRWNLGLALLLATVLLGLLYARPVLDLVRDILDAFCAPLTLRLTAVVILIMILGGILQETAGMDGIAAALEGLVPDGRMVLALLPSFVGLLPMVGGAMFSAPMVEKVGERLGASADQRTFVNYWFRHAWEYIFPIYPSFVLGAALLQTSNHQTAGSLWPLFVSSLVGGTLFGLLGIRQASVNQQQERRRHLWLLLRSSWPIALVLTLALILHVDLIISLLVTIGLSILAQRISLRTLADIAQHRVPWRTAITIFGAMAFRQVLETTNAVTALSTTLIQSQIPTWVALFLIPFFAGLLTGLVTGAFGIGFPIIIPLLSQTPPGMGEMAWVWAGGFLGVMMSPMHLCLSLTRDYFKAKWRLIYRRLVPATLLTAATAGFLLTLT